jgi:hypothetical protein
MLRSTPAQTPSRTVECSRCHRALGLLGDDHLTFVSHVNESLRASTAEARPDTCCTDFTEAPAGVSFLMTLWSSYRQKTHPNICPLGQVRPPLLNTPAWAGRSRGPPVNSDRGGPSNSPGGRRRPAGRGHRRRSLACSLPPASAIRLYSFGTGPRQAGASSQTATSRVMTAGLSLDLTTKAW